jgi:hypothetical protein
VIQVGSIHEDFAIAEFSLYFCAADTIPALDSTEHVLVAKKKKNELISDQLLE